MRELDGRLFRYVWRHSKREQMVICGVVLASLPFYFASLDLPRRIVNDAIMGKAFNDAHMTAPFLNLVVTWPDWLGGGHTELFAGFSLGRTELLVGLSLSFLALVLINGAFKYWINLAKGVLGERMLRRLRFTLFALMLRFTPEALREVRGSETATIIRDEVEPIGSFIGDAFVVPVFLGTQAMTALAFILMQNVWLGLAAGGIVAVQFVVIPKLRRQIIKLSRKRQLASRSLAGRVAEVFDGLEAVRANDTGRWERAEIGDRLHGLFDLRLRIYQRKFLVKYLNNLLAQVTPFMFYIAGGVLALRGQLDIGQLVAVLAAYRDLPPPLKELIDWDQQRLDVEVKYETVAAHFAGHRLRPADPDIDGPAPPLGSPLRTEGLVLDDAHAHESVGVEDVDIALPAAVALVSPGSHLAARFAAVIAGVETPRAGRMQVGAHDLSTLPRPVHAVRIAYAGPDPVLFPGSIRANILYGLRVRPLGPGSGEADERRVAEALRTGNPTESTRDAWIDYAALGLPDADALDRRVVALLERFGMGDDLYRFGLDALCTDPHDGQEDARMIEARTRLRRRFLEGGVAGLVIPFARDEYNAQATIAENLLFGVPRNPALIGRRLAAEPRFRASLAHLGLLDTLADTGVRLARDLVEIFRDLPAGHPLFRRFSLIEPDDLPEFGRRLAALRPNARLSAQDSEVFLGLALLYVEPRQRLGLLDDDLRARIVAARAAVHEALEQPMDDVVCYDPCRINPYASVLDNLLFGRIDRARMHGESLIQREVHAVLAEMDLEDVVKRRGLMHEVGNRGQSLSARERALVGLARALLRRPEILVVDGPAEHLHDAGRTLREAVDEAAPGASLFAVVDRGTAASFPRTVELRARAVPAGAEPADDDAEPLRAAE